MPSTIVTIVLMLAMMLPSWAQDGPSSLKIRVVEGDGAVYTRGSRATHGLTVEVTSESGQPVPTASVNFVLPSSGASGTFASGGRTEAQTTGADGRATVWGMRWNTTPGPVEIRIAAVKGPARGSAILTVHLDQAPPQREVSSGGHKWLWIAVAVAGTAVGGLAVVRRSSQTAPAAAAVATNPLRIGLPSVTLEKP